MQAAPAQDQFFNYRNADTELLGANCGDIPAGATAEQDEIELLGGCRNFRHCRTGLLVIMADVAPAP